MNAPDVLRNVADQYSSCFSYSDEGRVDFIDANGQREYILFKTRFVRPDRIRFDWQDYGPSRGKSEAFSSFVANSDTGRVTYTWDPNISEGDVLRACSEVNGCSAGAVRVVLPLLDPRQAKPPGHHYLEITDARLADQALVGDSMCHVVTGSWFNGDELTLWVAISDCGIRRVNRKSMNGYLNQFYTYNKVSFDGEIASNSFNIGD